MRFVMLFSLFCKTFESLSYFWLPSGKHFMVCCIKFLPFLVFSLHFFLFLPLFSSHALGMAKGHCPLCATLPPQDHDFTTEEKEWVQRTACKHSIPMLIPLPRLFYFPAYQCIYCHPFLKSLQNVLKPQNIVILPLLIRLLG